MVGRVGYAPTTPAMSMQYSTIELTAQMNSLLYIVYIRINNEIIIKNNEKYFLV